VEVKVGIQHVSREIVVESTESATEVEKELLSSMAIGGDGVFTLSDERGRKVLRKTPGTSASARSNLGLFARVPRLANLVLTRPGIALRASESRR
jgi:hypothetical protein